MLSDAPSSIRLKTEDIEREERLHCTYSFIDVLNFSLGVDGEHGRASGEREGVAGSSK